MKKWSVKIRRIHRYIMAFIAIQMLIWFASGLYMVTLDLGFIRGNHIIKSPITLSADAQYLSFSDVLSAYPAASDISLVSHGVSFAYKFHIDEEQLFIDAITGVELPPLTESQVKTVALKVYAGNQGIHSVELLTHNEDIPEEINAKILPAWRVTFKGFSSDTLYISAKNAKVMTVRHTYWRWFDVMWMLHIMDYQTRSDVSNLLLRIFALLAFCSSLAGSYLLYIRIRINKRKSHSGTSVANKVSAKVQSYD